MKGVVLFGSERLARAEGTVLTEKLTRCNCVVNAPFAQPMLLQLDQASVSVSVCVQTWMVACLIQRALLPAEIHMDMPAGAHMLLCLLQLHASAACVHSITMHCRVNRWAM